MPNIVIDELHLMLRVTDVLIRNIIWAMIYNDLREVQQKKQPQHLDKLVQTIRSCGITFSVSHMYIYTCIYRLQYFYDLFTQVWKDKASGNKSDAYSWTSLRGNDRRTLLKKFTDYIPTLMCNNSGTVKLLWEVRQKISLKC